MKTSLRARSHAAVILVVALLVSALAIASTTSAGATRSVRGFDGSTVTVAGLGIKSLLPLSEVGSRARIKRFNDTNELPGIKINFADFADDHQDPATALSEARRLVTQVGVFAIVNDVSTNNPKQYFEQQHVPFFGGGFDPSYCSPKPSTKVWGFGPNGCIVPHNPSRISDLLLPLYQYSAKTTGKKHPTLLIWGEDNESGKNGTRIFGVASQGAGFKVVYTMHNVPPPPVSDYTPYVQQMLKGNHGSAPDAILCEGGTDCLNVYILLRQSGYKGVYGSGLYSDALVKAFNGSVAQVPFVIPSEDTPGTRQLKADMDAYQPGSAAKIDTGAVFGYASTDMFIQALKAVAKKGKSNITPENVQKYASTMTWQIKGLSGPTQYPKTTVMGWPSCGSEAYSDGTKWTVASPYVCSKTTYSPNLKLG